MSENHESAGVRIDLWLWAARFFKTRALAKQAIEGGKVELASGAACKPARVVRIGEWMTVRRGDEYFEIEVLEVAARRGSATIAQTLYQESAGSIERRAAEREQRRLQQSDLNHPPARPNKKARRQIRALPGGKAVPHPPWWPEW